MTEQGYKKSAVRLWDLGWRIGLLVLATVGAVFAAAAAINGASGTGVKLDWIDPALKSLTFSAVCMIVLFAAPVIKKFKFGGMELELAEASNTTTIQLKNMESEIEKLKEGLLSVGKVGLDVVRTASVPVPMPKLPSIKFDDDPNLGRFGGRAEDETGNYALSASFTFKTLDDPFVKVMIKLTDKNRLAPAGVRLFLHPTFSQPEVCVPIHDGVATLELLIYGGFTVGAWIEGTNTLLELNLATIPRAPLVVRTR